MTLTNEIPNTMIDGTRMMTNRPFSKCGEDIVCIRCAESKRIPYSKFVQIVAVTSLFFCNSFVFGAVDDEKLEALLELDPLDWSTIQSSIVIRTCTSALSDKSLTKQDQISKLYLLRGIALSYEGKLEESISDLTEALKLNSKDCLALRARGNNYASLKQFDKARADFENIIKLHPKSGIGYAELALCSYESLDQDSCKKFADKAIILDPECPEGYLSRSMAYLKEHKTKLALKDIDTSIMLSYGGGTPSAAIPYRLRAAMSLGFFDNPRKALPDLLMARRLDPSNTTTKGILCQYYFATGKYNLSFQLSYQLIKEQPARPDVQHMRAYCLVARNRPSEALQMAEALVRSTPQWWGSFLCRGEVFLSLNKYKNALQDFNKSLSLRHDHLVVMAAKAYLLASCPNAELRDGSTARTLASRCCEITEYKVPRYLMLLAAASAECGDYKEAVRLAKSSLAKAEPGFLFSEEYRNRLVLFENGKPFRFPSESRTLDYLFP